MKKISSSLLVLATLALAACGQDGEANSGSGASESGMSQVNSMGSMAENSMGSMMDGGGQDADATGETHTGSGDITEVSGERVSISHGPVESIGWPAMTMTFRAQSPDMAEGLNVGDPVSFQFRKAGEDYVLTTLSKAQ